MQSQVILVETSSGRLLRQVESLRARVLNTITSLFRGVLTLNDDQQVEQVDLGSYGVTIDGNPLMNATYAFCASIGMGANKKIFMAPQFNADVATMGNYSGQQRITSQGFTGSGVAIDSNWTALPFDDTVDTIVLPCDGFYEIGYHAVVMSKEGTLIQPVHILFVNDAAVSMDIQASNVTRYTTTTSFTNRSVIKSCPLGRVYMGTLKQGDVIRTSIMCNNPGGRTVILDEYHVYAWRKPIESSPFEVPTD